MEFFSSIFVIGGCPSKWLGFHINCLGILTSFSFGSIPLLLLLFGCYFYLCYWVEYNITISSKLCHIVAPLTALLKKNSVAWSDATTLAFQQLKEALTSIPFLVVPNFNQTFTVEWDSCGQAIGAVSMQEVHPLAFESKQFKGKNLAHPTYQKECFPSFIQLSNGAMGRLSK